MSGDAEQEYFSDGISEDITTDLSKVSALAVTARNTAFTFKGQAVDVCDVARKLSVSHVLEGSVRKAGERVRITAQLIDGATGDHVWAERYDRDLTDIFAIQDEISKAIVDALKIKLLPEEKKAIEKPRHDQRRRLQSLPDGAAILDRPAISATARREDRVIRLCKRAMEIDPDYPQAWALMGLAQANLRYAYSGNEGLTMALRRPTGARARSRHRRGAFAKAWHLALHGRTRKQTRRSRLRFGSTRTAGKPTRKRRRIHYRQGKWTRHPAPRACDGAGRVRFPQPWHADRLLSCERRSGPRSRSCRKNDALIQQVLLRDPDNGAALAFVALAFAALGDFDRARDYIERAILLDPDNLYMRYNVAWPLIAFFKDKDAALDLLEPALARAGRNLVSLASADRNLDPLRGDPRFDEMLSAAVERVGLSAPKDASPPAATSAPPRS